jgi:hypothetical protein
MCGAGHILQQHQWAGWTDSTNWNTATAVDDWYGVTVVGGHVTTLDFSSNQLSGSLPDLSALTQLEYLYLHNNQLVTLIPPSITSTAIFTDQLTLCGGNNILASNNPAVISWGQAHNPGWTQGCGLGTAPTATADPDYTTGAATTLTIPAPGVLANDSLGTPAGSITFFGGGSLGGGGGGSRRRDNRQPAAWLQRWLAASQCGWQFRLHAANGFSRCVHLPISSR